MDGIAWFSEESRSMLFVHTPHTNIGRLGACRRHGGINIYAEGLRIERQILLDCGALVMFEPDWI